MYESTTAFEDWTVCERGDSRKIELKTGVDKPGTPAMELTRKALAFCSGPTDVCLRLDDQDDEPALEGPCILSVFTRNLTCISNMQVFQMCQYGQEERRKDIVVVRKSIWDRKKDFDTITQGGELLKSPSCRADSFVLWDGEAEETLSMCKGIGDLLREGVFYEACEKDFQQRILKAEDSFGVVHTVEWRKRLRMERVDDILSDLNIKVSTQSAAKKKVSRLLFVF